MRAANSVTALTTAIKRVPLVTVRRLGAISVTALSLIMGHRSKIPCCGFETT